MNINYDFYYIKKQDYQNIVLTLDNGKTVAGHFEIKDDPSSLNDEKILTYKQLQIIVDKAAFQIFLEQALSLQSFKDHPSHSNTLRNKLLEINTLEEIGQLISSWHLLLKKSHQFQKLQPFEIDEAKDDYFNEHEKKDLFGKRIKKIQLAFDLILACEKLKPNDNEQTLHDLIKNIKEPAENWIKTDQVPLCSGIIENLESGIERISKKQEISFYDVREVLLLKNYYNECQIIFNNTYKKLKYVNRPAHDRFKILLKPMATLFERIKNTSLSQCNLEASRIGLARLLTVTDTIKAVLLRSSISKPPKMNSVLPSFMLENSFLKILPLRARIEEKSILERFAFSQKASVVPAYHFKKLQLDQLGVSLDGTIPYHRQFPIKGLTLEKQKNLAQKLYDQPSRDLWLKVNANDEFTLDIQRKSFEFFSKKSFKVKLGKEILPFSFENLLTYREYQKFPADIEIACEEGAFHKRDYFFFSFNMKNENQNEFFIDALRFFYQVDPNRQSFFSIYIPDRETNLLVSNCEAQIWGYLNDKKEWVDITFQQLYHHIWIDQTVITNTPLRTIDPKNQTPCHAFFSSLMQEKDKEQIIKLCETLLWEYQNKEKKWISVSFQQLSLMWLDEIIPAETCIRSFQSFKMEDNKFQLLEVLKLPTIFIVPELTRTYDTKEIGPIQRICGKKKLKHLWTFDEIQTGSPAFNNIIQRLNDRSRVKAFLILLHQFLDFHGGNLGVIPLYNSHLYEMSQNQYFLRKGQEWGQSQTLFDLIKLYLSEEIDDRTAIGLIKSDEPQKFYTLEIGKYTQLKSVLNDTKWEIQIFDGDQVISENETLALFSHWIKNKMPQRSIASIIPMHNFLLHLTNFKDAPLTNEFLLEIQKILKDTRLLQWCMNKHSFAWQFINQKHHYGLEKIILEKIQRPEFSLGYYESQNLTIDTHILRRMMAKDLADLSKHKDLWDHVQNIIDPNWWKLHTIKAEDLVTVQIQDKGLGSIEGVDIPETLKKLATLYRLDLEELIKLNSGKTEQLTVGTSLQVKTPFTWDTPGAQKQREVFIKAILPLDSVKQLISRQKRVINCLQYLDFYHRLCSLKNEHDPVLIGKTISEVLSSPVHPLTTERKNQFLQKILKKETFLFLDEILQSCASLKTRPSKKQRTAQSQNHEVFEKISLLKKEQNPFLVLETINEILSNYTNSLSIKTRNKFLEKTHMLLKSLQEQALLILPEILQEYIPTYEKLAFVMYPLLADVKQLNLFYLGQKFCTKEYDFMAGCLVGQFNVPLESIISKARKRFKNDAEALLVIQQIVERIEEEKNKQQQDSLNFVAYLRSKNG